MSPRVTARSKVHLLALGWLAGSVALACQAGGQPASEPSGTGGKPPAGPTGSGGPTSGGQSPGSGGTGGAMAGGGAGAVGATGGGAGNPATADAAGASAGGGGSANVDANAPSGSSAEITVAAGADRRLATIVTFPWEGDVPGGSIVLRGEGGVRLPLQIAAGRATFILPELAANAEARFSLETAAAEATAGVTVAKEADAVKVNVGAATALRYQTVGKLPAGVGQAFLRGGYLHPIFTPTGLMVTDDYPGDHRHHHGLWSAWASSSFEGREVDFWNMGGRSAKVDFDSLAGMWQGPVHGGFESKQVHVSLAGGQSKVALNELWRVTAYRTHVDAPPYFVFDLDSTQEAASTSPVMLHKYIYGGFALRGHASWGGGGGAVFLTSEGKNRASGDGTNARWCYIGGRVDGKPAGYAALGHPNNFRAPQPVRINPTDPFFSIAPVRDSGFDIAPGKPFVSRYRIVISDGAPDAALLDRLWNDYARPPTVTLKRN